MRPSMRILRGVIAGLTVVCAVAARGGPIDPFGRTPTPESPGGPGRWGKIPGLQEAIESFNRRDYDHALELLKAARKERADLPPAGVLLAQVALFQDQVAVGRAALERAAVEEPDDPSVYLVFGDLARAEGHWTDAWLHYGKAAELTRSGKWADAQRRTFLIHHSQGQAAVAEARKQWPDAREALVAWLELEPKNAEARRRLAHALFALDKPTEALDELKRAVGDDPDQEPAAITMGWLYTQKGDLKKAAEWMEYAVKVAPEDSRARLGHAAWLLQQGQVERANDATAVAAKLDPAARGPKLLRGRIAQFLGDYTQAESDFEALHRDDPEDFQASNLLALALAGQEDKAKRERALQLAEGNAKASGGPTALATLGWVYFRLGRLDEAERALHAAAPGGGLGPEGAYYLSRVYSERGRLDDARTLLRAALAVDDNFPARKEAQDWLDRLSTKPE